jgi:hypothetical protein
MLDARKQPRNAVDIWHCCVAQTRFDSVACTACCQQNTHFGERTDEILLLSASLTASYVLVKKVYISWFVFNICY